MLPIAPIDLSGPRGAWWRDHPDDLERFSTVLAHADVVLYRLELDNIPSRVPDPAVTAAARTARAEARAHLRGLLGDWSEDLGFDRDLPAQLARAERNARWRRSLDSLARFSETMAHAAGTVRDTAGAVRGFRDATSPLDGIRALLDEQGNLEQALAANRRRLTELLELAVRDGHRARG